ncbi:MAG TPA: hypothetical protein VFE04_11070 [Puia sp.]|nr:hypothetical protein [Puia sp.]
MNSLIFYRMTALSFLLFVSSISTAQTIEIKSDTFFINSVIIPNHENTKSLVTILGKPDRIYSLESKIWTYDKPGMCFPIEPF